ncbi:hypothetical protein V8017_01065 [Stenotrophomonas rhizophila]
MAPAGTVITPALLMVNPAGAFCSAMIRLAPTTGAPLSVSLASTVGVVPPVAEEIAVANTSLLATSALACTGTAGVVALLSPGVGSVVPVGSTSVTLLAGTVAGVALGAVPLTSSTTLSPTPTLTCTLTALPVPLDCAHDDAAVLGWQLQATLVSSDDTVSTTPTPCAAEGPALLTWMRYCTAPPAATGLALSNVLVTLSCACRASALVSVAVLLPGVGSPTSAGAVTVTVLLSGFG